jgi:hypothetical protein
MRCLYEGVLKVRLLKRPLIEASKGQDKALRAIEQRSISLSRSTHTHTHTHTHKALRAALY